jgi:hypothetical protein
LLLLINFDYNQAASIKGLLKRKQKGMLKKTLYLMSILKKIKLMKELILKMALQTLQAEFEKKINSTIFRIP